MKKSLSLFYPAIFIFLFSCLENNRATPMEGKKPDYKKGTYGYDAGFLKKYLGGLIELTDSSSGAKVLLCSTCQGRVLTSGAGDSGNSFGWINYELVASQKKKAQFNPIGGEERIWIGPEGGQFAFYFKQGDSFNIARWQVPPIIDTLPYQVAFLTSSAVSFSRSGNLRNYSGHDFNIDITRTVKILPQSAIESGLQVTIPRGIKFVAYQSENTIVNKGDSDWKKENGLAAVWLLSMMTPSEATAVFIPFENSSDARELITNNYFGPIPPDRLIVKEGLLILKCDGKFRSKIGLSSKIAKPFAASYDFKRNILTILHFNVDKNAMYVNSKWEIQKEPFNGDVVNSYNDGPLANGSQLGPFYEIESSSLAKELRKGESLVHKQMIFHFEGKYEALDSLAQKILGINLADVKNALHL